MNKGFDPDVDDSIDCSTYIGLILRGKPFHESPYSKSISKAMTEWGSVYGSHGLNQNTPLLTASFGGFTLGAGNNNENDDVGNNEGDPTTPDDDEEDYTGGDTTIGELSDNIHEINTKDYNWAIDPSAYKYKVSLRSYEYNKVDGEKFKDNISESDEPTPVRYASQLGNWMHDMGWEIDYSDTFEEVDVGDIIFWAKYETRTFDDGSTEKILDETNSYIYREPTRYKHISHVGICVGVTYINDFDETAEYKQGNYFYLNQAVTIGVKHYEIGAYRVSPDYDPPETTYIGKNNVLPKSKYIMDIRYRHTIAEATGFSPRTENGTTVRPHHSKVIYNTTLEKKDPLEVCMIARPDLGAMTSGEHSGNVSSVSKENITNIDELYKPGTYYLTKSITGTLPTILRKIYWKKTQLILIIIIGYSVI